MNAAQRDVYACRGIVGGEASGLLLRSSDGICFYTVDPKTGVVAEKGHPLIGQCIAGRVLLCPHGKGSSVVQLDGLYQLVKHGVAPACLIVESLDTVLVACAVIMGIPLVTDMDEAFDTTAQDGARVTVNAESGTATLDDSSGPTTSAEGERDADL